MIALQNEYAAWSREHAIAYAAMLAAHAALETELASKARLDVAAAHSLAVAAMHATLAVYRLLPSQGGTYAHKAHVYAALADCWGDTHLYGEGGVDANKWAASQPA